MSFIHSFNLVYRSKVFLNQPIHLFAGWLWRIKRSVSKWLMQMRYRTPKCIARSWKLVPHIQRVHTPLTFLLNYAESRYVTIFRTCDAGGKHQQTQQPRENRCKTKTSCFILGYFHFATVAFELWLQLIKKFVKVSAKSLR